MNACSKQDNKQDNFFRKEMNPENFADGNGRMARLWHTALLSKWRSVFSYIPIESQIEKFQEDYYQAIAVCHSAGNSDIFIE